MNTRFVNSDKKHIYFTIFIGVISVLANCFISLFITPRITNTIGIESYGYVTLAKNFVSYATMLTTALNSYAARYMSIAYLKGEMNKFKEYYSTVFIGDLIVGIILLAGGTFFVGCIDRIIKVNVSLIKDVRLLFFLCFIAFFVNTISTVFLATGQIKDRMETINIIRTLSYIVEIIVLVICFWVINPSIWYVGLASLSMSLVVFFGSYVLTVNTIPERSISIKSFSFDSLKELVGNGFWNSANSLGNTLNSGLDLLISNILLSNIAMGQVSIAKTINNIIFALYVAVSQAYQPKLLKHYSNKNDKGLIKELKRSMKVSGIITNCIIVGFFVVGKEFLCLWIPGQNIDVIYWVTIIAMLPCVTEGCIYPLYYVYMLTVKNKIPCIVTIIGGFLNVVSMYILLRYTNLGVFAIVTTTAVIMNLIVGVFNPIYICKCMSIKRTTFSIDILSNILILIVAGTVTYCLKNTIIGEMTTWITLIIKIIFLGLVCFFVQILLVLLQYKMIMMRGNTNG